MKETQLQMIRSKVLKDGYVTRNWCLERFVTRLGSRIYDLKEEGMEFEGKYVRTDYGQDYKYTLLNEPKQEALL